MWKKILLLILCVFAFFSSSHTFALSCADTYEPVCGEDWKTYRNNCYLQSATRPEDPIEIVFEWSCEDMQKNEPDISYDINIEFLSIFISSFAIWFIHWYFPNP